MLLRILGASGPPYLKLTLRNSIRPSRLCTGVKSRAVASLFRFLFENIVQPIQQNGSELQIVPHAERAQDSAVSHRGQRAEGDKAANAETAVDDLVRADPEKDRGRKQADGLQHAVVGHDDEIAPENLFRDGEKLVQHRVAEDRSRPRRL